MLAVELHFPSSSSSSSFSNWLSPGSSTLLLLRLDVQPDAFRQVGGAVIGDLETISVDQLNPPLYDDLDVVVMKPRFDSRRPSRPQNFSV
jgi:hypothetical protein